MKRKVFRTLALLFLMAFSFQIYAIPAYPYPVAVTLPDGSTITLIKKGDEHFSYDMTEDSVIVVKNKKGFYNYAIVENSGKLQDSKIRAYNKDQRTVTDNAFVAKIKRELPFEKISNQRHEEKISKAQKIQSALEFKNTYPRTGSPKSLVILVEFKNKEFTVQKPKEEFTNLLNEKGYSKNGGTGSAKDYFYDNSMGRFNPNFVVVGPYKLDNDYQYYGKNTVKNNNDTLPAQMIADACKAAAKDVNFADYDTDNDGYVDNVFVYYAGHNEAERGGDDTVWPHRWAIYPGYNFSGTAKDITFNNKKISDYACTSELKGSRGSNMCGIGTFTHEFGHVLGLPDFYATGGQKHNTLGVWDVMDYGPYLNGGRTPPLYSAFERFSLGYLKPTILNKPQKVTVKPISSTNEAYLISESGKHNLSETNPNPRQFFLLENRQKKGWDKYLPSKGMLITRINYNQTKWDRNEPNNNPKDMGVDIIEADGSKNNMSSASHGVPFPGTKNVRTFVPKLISGKALKDTLTNIQSVDTLITFVYGDDGTNPIVKTKIETKEYNTVQGTPSETNTLEISGSKLIAPILVSLKMAKSSNFEMKLESDENWVKSLSLSPNKDSVVLSTNILIRYNPTAPSYTNKHYDDIVISTARKKDDILIRVSGKSSRPIYVIPPENLTAENITYKDFEIKWNEVMDNEKPAAGYYVTLLKKDEEKKDTVFKHKWIKEKTDTIITGLVSDKEYIFMVQASDKNMIYQYENISQYSQPLSIKTLPYPYEKDLRVNVNNGNVKVYVPYPKNVSKKDKKATIYVYDVSGKTVMSTDVNSDIVVLKGLPKNRILIVKSGNYVAKIIII